MGNVVYLDNAATTAVDERVVKKMLPYFSEKYANPATKWTSSLSKEVHFAVEEARKSVAKIINSEVDEIFFTSGGTEADNTALKGIAFSNMNRGNEIISTPIEHEAVLKSLYALEKFGFEIKFVRVDSKGFVDPMEIVKMITGKTILISVMHANNEIGTIEPIREIGMICRERNIYFHTDAVQTVGHLKIDVKNDYIDLLSLSGHKFYGPKGVGAIFVRNGVKIQSFMDGGGQEKGVRSGTLNTTGIVGLGEAARIAFEEMEETEEKIKNIRNKLWERIQNEIPKVYLNGPDGETRIANNLSFNIIGIRNEPLLVALNEKGIIAGGGSACSAEEKNPSHVLESIGVRKDDIFSVIRITLGKYNKETEIDTIVYNFKEVIKQLREMSPFWTE